MKSREVYVNFSFIYDQGFCETTRQAAWIWYVRHGYIQEKQYYIFNGVYVKWFFETRRKLKDSNK
jgi:hypothetical protein